MCVCRIVHNLSTELNRIYERETERQRERERERDRERREREC